jgi:LPS export ABC transporter protein LptC
MIKRRSMSLKYKNGFIALSTIVLLFALSFLSSCGHEKKRIGEAIKDRDSMPVMRTTDVVTLISDSGITRFRIKTPEWLIYDRRNPSFWAFEKGIYLEKFDPNYHVEASIKCDTAYFYDKQRLWKLIGHVAIKNTKGEKFNTELLFWDQMAEKVYSDKKIRIEQLDKIIVGHGFESNQQMTQYVIHNIEGIFYVSPDSVKASPTDTVQKVHVRPSANNSH